MIERILAAVDDSPAGLAAALAAIDLAAVTHADLRFVHVSPRTEASRGPTSSEESRSPGEDLLSYVSGLARHAEVGHETELLHGDPGEEILRAAHRWSASVIVIGRRDTGRPGEGYVGGETRQVLEFCEQPVLVVPRRVSS